MPVPIAMTPAVTDGSTVFTAASVPVNPILLVGNLFQVGNGVNYTWDGGVVFTFGVAPAPGETLTLLADGTIPVAAASSTAAAVRSYTTSELLASIRQRTFTAAAPRDFDDPSVLRVLNEMAITYLLKLIAKRRTNYLLVSLDIPVSSGVPGINIPSDAMAGAIRSATMIVGNIPYGLVEMDPATADASNITPLSTQFPTGYYWQNAQLVLWPTQSLSGTLRIKYHRRPSTIVKENTCIQITGFPGGAAAGNYRASFVGLPAGFAGAVPVDVLSNSPNFYRWQVAQAIVGITSTTIDIPGPQPSNLAINDWICLSGTAPVVSDAPAEVIEALLQKTALKMMEGKGAADSMQRMESGLAAAEGDCGPLIEARNTGAHRKLSAFPGALSWWPLG